MNIHCLVGSGRLVNGHDHLMRLKGLFGGHIGHRPGFQAGIEILDLLDMRDAPIGWRGLPGDRESDNAPLLEGFPGYGRDSLLKKAW